MMKRKQIVKRMAFAYILLESVALTSWGQTLFRDLDIEKASRQAVAENKLVFVDFYTDWCGPCKQMSRNVFPQKKVGQFMNSRFVCIQRDAEKNGREEARRYQVKAYPTFLLIDPQKGEVISRLMGSMSADLFLEKMESAVDTCFSESSITGKYKQGERSPLVVNRYAFQLLEAGQEKEGYEVINNYFESLTDQERLSKENSFLFLRYTTQLGDKKAAFMVQNKDRFAEEV